MNYMALLSLQKFQKLFLTQDNLEIQPEMIQLNSKK